MSLYLAFSSLTNYLNGSLYLLAKEPDKVSNLSSSQYDYPNTILNEDLITLRSSFKAPFFLKNHNSFCLRNRHT